MTDPKDKTPEEEKPVKIPLSEQIKNAHATGDGAIGRPEPGKEESGDLPE